MMAPTARPAPQLSLFNDLGTRGLPEVVEQKKMRDHKPPSEASMPAEQIRDHRRNRC